MIEKRILLTGHTGFIGKPLYSLLKTNPQFEVIPVARSIGFDLTKKDCLEEVENVGLIIHLASSVGVSRSWDDPEGTYENNILSTLRILEYARKWNSSVIHMSSYVYGTPDYLPIDEAHALKGYSPYARSKIYTDQMCEAYARDFSLAVTILRPFSLYGPNQAGDGLIPTIIKQVRCSNQIEVDNLDVKRDFLWIGDLVAAIDKVVNEPQQGLNIFNIGFGKSYSVQEVIDTIKKVAGKNLPIRSSNKLRPMEVMDCFCNNKLFSERYSWAPAVSLEKGISLLLKEG
jgi:nucleoside-diphosphate-sugar epimerase